MAGRNPIKEAGYVVLDGLETAMHYATLPFFRMVGWKSSRDALGQVFEMRPPNPETFPLKPGGQQIHEHSGTIITMDEQGVVRIRHLNTRGKIILLELFRQYIKKMMDNTEKMKIDIMALEAALDNAIAETETR